MSRAARHLRAPSLRKEGLWVVQGTIATTVAGLVANLIVPNLLTIADAGRYFIAMSAVNVASLILRLGMERSAVRAVTDDRTKAMFLRTIVLLGGFVFALGILVLALGVWPLIARGVFHSPELARLAPIIAVWMGAEAYRLILSESLRGMRRVFVATWLGNAGRAVLAVIFLAALAVAGVHSLRVTIGVSAAASVIVLLVAGVGLSRAIGGQGRRPLRGRLAVRSLLRMSWPFYVTGLWAFASNQADVLVGGAVLSHRGLALYAAASKLSLLLALPAVALNLLLAPIIPRLAGARKWAELQARIRSITTLYAVPIIVFGALLIAGNHLIVDLVYPDAYASAGPILAILALGPICTALTGPNGFTLMMADRGRIVSRLTSLISAAQLAAMIVFGHLVGVYGLAIASSAGTVTLNIVLSVVTHRELHIATEPYVRPRQILDSLAPALRIVRRLRGRAGAPRPPA